jgi:hypothetical protein
MNNQMHKSLDEEWKHSNFETLVGIFVKSMSGRSFPVETLLGKMSVGEDLKVEFPYKMF